MQAPTELTVPVLLIASVVVVSVLGWIIKPLKTALILIPVYVRERYHFHRLLTAGWVHADTTHLLFNMFTLYFFAHQVERALGDVRFLVLYVSAVVVAFIPTTLRQMKNARYGSLGASGAVAAVTFSAILLHPGLKLSLLFLPIPIPGYVYALGYVAYSAYHSWRSRDGINHDAHFSGAIYGSILTYAFEPDRVVYTLQHFF
ncbi:MAG: rhomboid family intramembrane serine protease [Labilithrix sp.]|nr:rhomboid family intramembrane serine protease [Labilithrix sp.]